LTEAEVRARIIDVWLKDHGFAPQDLRLESAFNVRVGRTVRRVGQPRRARKSTLQGRSDYVVRTCDGKNLLLIEAKADQEPLDIETRDQALSYALLLSDGFAPFTIVTNGRETEIYETLTRKSLSGSLIPLDHPYVRAGYVVTCTDLALRTEALERLVSLNEHNLLTFCREQVSYRMRTLRSLDVNSG
jgi:type I site-specific restriction endonuclease